MNNVGKAQRTHDVYTTSMQLHDVASTLSQHGVSAGMGSYVICEQRRSRLECESMQSDLGILCSSTYTTLSIDSVSSRPREGPV